MSLISFSLAVRIKHRKKEKSHQLLTKMFVQTTNQLRNRSLSQGETNLKEAHWPLWGAH